MQLTEFLFFFLILVFTLRLFIGPIRSTVSEPLLVGGGVLLIVVGILFEGFRWQIIPAYLAFCLLALGTLKRTTSKLYWRGLAALPISILLVISISLSLLLPVFSLPEPEGPYSVGTFEYTITDDSRIERFNPETNRELAVLVWYPSPNSTEGEFPVRTLWQDVYSGDYDLLSFFTSYLGQIDTHSQIESPIVSGEQFPVLVFNHGFMAPREQNTILMEHLASHGYIIFSIAHTYQSTKVFLSSSEKVLFDTGMPEDLAYVETSSGPITGVRDFIDSEDGSDHSLLDAQLFSIFSRYQSLDSENDRRDLVEEVLGQREQYLIGPRATSDTLYNYFHGRMTVMGSFAQTWVEDIQFVVDELANINAPVAGFTDAMDVAQLGVFGHSFGSAAAGEFCKLDSRCKAGLHIDGSQQGYNWDTPLLAPFLVMYSANFYGGNDFAYVPSPYDLWNMTIDGIDHLDFTDLGLALHGLQGPGMMGDVNNARALGIINDVALSFFDHYLKGLPLREDLSEIYPELTLELQ